MPASGVLRAAAASLLLIALCDLGAAAPSSAAYVPRGGPADPETALRSGGLLDAQECGPGKAAPCPGVGEDSPGSNGSAPTGSVRDKLVTVGAPATPFELKNLEGHPVSFDPKQIKGAVLLVFWSMFCEPCREELPFLDEFVRKNADQGLKVLTVNVDGAKLTGAVARYRDLNQLGFPVVMDEKQGESYAAAKSYGVTGTPSLFLVGSDGTVRWREAGRMDPEVLNSEVRKILGP